jgi:manganese/zinc/iron transport system permease protein
MIWTELDTWIVLTGALTAMACAVPGVFLLLNKQSMLGDAISHAVLPGLAIGFLVSGSRDPLPMFIGAVLAGLFTGVVSGVIERRGRVEAGASLGVVFCSLFALGLILIRLAADHVDLDPGCVLYGALELAVIDSATVPRIVWQSGAILILNLFLAVAFFKELQVVAFDPRFAKASGIPSGLIQQGLTVATALTTVVAFESVGSILVIAMLIVPGASAMLLSRSVSGVLIWSLVVAISSAVLGHVLAISVGPAWLGLLTGRHDLGSLSSAGMMAASAGGIFFSLLAASRLAQRLRSSTPRRAL